MTVKTKRQQAVETGRWAEKMAAWYLRFKGYRIIDIKVTTPVAEIDLIARKGKTWIIVEVKYRKSMAEAAESIRYTQQQRLVGGRQMVKIFNPAKDYKLNLVREHSFCHSCALKRTLVILATPLFLSDCGHYGINQTNLTI